MDRNRVHQKHSDGLFSTTWNMYDKSAYYSEGPIWMTGTKIASAVIKLAIFNKMNKSSNKECPCFIHKQDMKIVDVATRFHKSQNRTYCTNSKK